MIQQVALFKNPKIEEIDDLLDPILKIINRMDIADRVIALNNIRKKLHMISPFKNEPVDCVEWIEGDLGSGNDYNPNTVAPPEMRLLEHSVSEDGYTQPIVTWLDSDCYEVVDGFHRNRIAKESEIIRDRLHGYLPITIVNEWRTDRNDRIAATIRHNRARGKHRVEAMSDIVVELKRRNWSDDRIGKELGMDSDEVLRLCQITGLSEMFKDQQFSQAWDVEHSNNTMGEEIITDIIADYKSNDKDRIFHTWDKWECFHHGFYAERLPDGLTLQQGEQIYFEFLSDVNLFKKHLQAVTTEWIFSCEHYLTNERMNRIAWLGQAAVAHAKQIPSLCRGGYHQLNEEQQIAADNLAHKYLNRWLKEHDREEVSLEAARGKTEPNLY